MNALARNQRAFTEAVAAARGPLLRALAARQGEPAPRPDADAPAPDPAAIHEDVARRAGLSPFEHWLLLLAAGAEIDPAVRQLCGAWHGDAAATRPTFALALAVHPAPHWSALSPDAPLRRLRLLTLEAGPGLTDRPLAIDELVLHHCLGLDVLHLAVDDRLARVAPDPVFEGWGAAIDALAASLGGGAMLGIEGDPAHARAIACAAAKHVALYAPRPGEPLPPSDAALERLAVLGDGGLLIEREEDIPAAEGWARRMPVFVIGPAALRHAVVAVPPVTTSERERHWRHALNGATPTDPGALRTLAGEASFAPAEIDEIARAANAGGKDMLDALLARRHRRRHEALTSLATRIVPRGRWDDLVLPEAQKAQLAQLIDQVRHRDTVLDEWGFGARDSRGRGLGALFAGPSGTGKTMASEVVAGALGRELFRVDLAALISKFVGETEKHLERLFAAAEQGSVVLLFDEADALFGKRGAVREGMDRYANQEVSYLLQRIESFDGLAILTTNLADAIDPAFLRRFRFVLNFAFPDHAQRVAIWRSVFPEALPRGRLDLDRLARLSLSGGAIRNVAVNAAYLAAAAETRLGMPHLMQAAEAELAKHNQRMPREARP